jgi:CRISPR-associated protein Csd2
MTDAVCNDPARRHDFVILFDVQDGNPNGDPDAGNLPRLDPETMQGLVTDVCLKRKVRDYVDATRGNEERYKIYVQSRGVALNSLHQRAYDSEGLKSTGAKQRRADVEKVRNWMCNNFYDIRVFGAVMTTEVNCGQVRGPIQLTFSRSIDPVVPLDIAITRVAITRQQDAEVIEGEDGSGEGGKVTEMGRKAILPYGLYRGFGFFSPSLAADTGTDAEDLELFWEALQKMWSQDRSASRGLMECRGVYVFSHKSKFGEAPAHRLFDVVCGKITRKQGVEIPRSINDYVVPSLEDILPDVPEGVEVDLLSG